MSVNIFIEDDEYYDDAQLLVRSFYMNEKVQRSVDVFHFEKENIVKIDENIFINANKFLPRKAFNNKQERAKNHNEFKKALYESLSLFTNKTLNWGFLTGVRPTKRAISLFETGKNREEVIKALMDTYLLKEEKARLCVDISLKEKEILNRFKNPLGIYRGYSMYIDIPFCESICNYCSFAKMPMDFARKENLVEKYLIALKKEMLEVSKLLNQKTQLDDFKRLHTIYIGGGTPSILDENQIKDLILFIKKTFDCTNLLEFSFEAGRPDSSTKEKLEVLKELGVNRISINPQTMNEKTLLLIGRKHSTEDIIEKYNMAKKIGFDNINMDLILGLPEETVFDMNNTIEAIKGLKPDSVTFHALAIKRSSRLNNTTFFKAEDFSSVYEKINFFCKDLKMHPYYMYRQQNMVSNLENIGYARSGKEGLYNILIMEEVIPIIAFGAGASSKFIFKNEDKKIVRIENVKNVNEYINRIDKMIERKKEVLERYLDNEKY